MLVIEHPIADLAGADYNPRRIDPSAVERLCESIREIGIVKPIIVRGKTIVAGHQRTRALRAMGLKTAPCFLLSSDTTVYDEVRFNQLHNVTLPTYTGDTVAISDCELIPFNDAEAIRRFPQLPAEFLTCRNFQFGAQQFRE